MAIGEVGAMVRKAMMEIERSWREVYDLRRYKEYASRFLDDSGV